MSILPHVCLLPTEISKGCQILELGILLGVGIQTQTLSPMSLGFVIGRRYYITFKYVWDREAGNQAVGNVL